MNDMFEARPFATGACEMVGRLIVKRHDEGLLKTEDVNTVLHTALTDVAPGGEITANKAA